MNHRKTIDSESQREVATMQPGTFRQRLIHSLDKRSDTFAFGALLVASGLGVASLSQAVEVITPVDTSPVTAIGAGALLLGAVVTVIGAKEYKTD